MNIMKVFRLINHVYLNRETVFAAVSTIVYYYILFETIEKLTKYRHYNIMFTQ